jgi:hypothetical protein
MNASSLNHIPEDTLENYGMGRLDSLACPDVEEHLLICESCQMRLEEIDEYTRVAKAAAQSTKSRSSADERPLSRKQPIAAQVLV